MNSAITERMRLVKNQKAKNSDAGRHRTGRVSKNDWLEAALKLLETEGCESVRVEALAKKLNISKSGFYWHFKNRNTLLEELKAYWVDQFTKNITDDQSLQALPGAERLAMASHLIRTRQENRYDLAFYSWAQKDLNIRELVQDVRDIRMTFIRKAFEDIGYSGEELEARARLFVIYHSWSTITFPTLVGGETDDLSDASVRILCGMALSTIA
ncbi:MAG: TetR/AcrR family transcriptional regulator [Proteobacteria bacterium]|nr:TetR/AcrR family transcriptional regulator [Pseudomonadota bacterium]